MPDWQGKRKYSIMASYLAMYVGFLAIIISILYMLIVY
jgi:hypothetical protein